VSLLRRHDPAPAPLTEEPAQVGAPASHGGKGRPTPKRSEAEKRRRTPVIAPKTRREAYKTQRSRIRETRRETRLALATGDESKLPARDRGPARRFARDRVDSRRSIMWLAAVLFFAVLGLSGGRRPHAAAIANAAVIAVFVAMVGYAVAVARRIKAAVAEQFGDKESYGITSYAALRMLQFRRLRLPKPMVPAHPGPAGLLQRWRRRG